MKVLDPQKSINNNFSRDVCVIDINLKSSPPWIANHHIEISTKAEVQSKKNDLLSINDFLILLIKGEMFGFITPKNSKTNQIIYH